MAMVAYVALMLLVWPDVKHATDTTMKVPLALLPALPMLYVIWLMARRVLHSDELEQRTHLIGLGAATGASAVFSLIAGFLAAARVFELDSAAMLLFWVFPLQMFCYGGVRAWAARRYGSTGICIDGEDGMPRLRHLLIAGMLLAFVALVGYLRGMESLGLGILSGMAAGLLAFALVLALRRWFAQGGRPTDK